MHRYIIRRIIMLIPILLAVSFLVYFVVDLAEGDVVDVIAGPEVSAEEKEQMREELGLNDPLLVRYARYMWDLLHGDMGESYATGNNVFDVYMQRLPATLLLAITSMMIAVAIAVPLGIIAAVKQNSIWDSGSMLLGLLGISIPAFWLGLILIITFAEGLGWFPSFGFEDGWKSLVLPAIVVGYGQAALIMRTTRSSMLEVLRQDYLRTARAKGVSERIVILKHAFKNVLIPLLTVLATSFGMVLGGAVVVETVFSWPGVGRLLVDSINSRDTNAVTGVLIMTTMLSSVVILIVDICYAFVDPRIKARYISK